MALTYGELITKEDEARLSTINDLLTSYWHNRNDTYMKMICNDLINKVQGELDVPFHDDTDVIYGFLVIVFGEYEVSPRTGRIDDNKKGLVTTEIRQFMSEFMS